MDLGGKLTRRCMRTCASSPCRRTPGASRKTSRSAITRKPACPGGTPRFVGCYTHLHNDSPDARPETRPAVRRFLQRVSPHLLTAMLAETYRDLHFVWSTNLDYDLIAQIRPQIVISEIAERFMGTVPTDEFKVTLD